MNYDELIEHIKFLDENYSSVDLNREIHLLIETDDGDTVVGILTNVGLWHDDDKYGLDFISKIDDDMIITNKVIE